MSDAYAAEITKHAVARASVSMGYTKCSVAALDSLADVVQNYIETYGALIKEQSETGGRTHPGLYDAMSALNTINEKQQSWVELCHFAFPPKDKSKGWCQPFPAVIPPFPVAQSKKLFTTPTEAPEDYPSHLPPYPPAHTYTKGEPKKRKAESSKSSRAKKIAAAKSIQNSLTSSNSSSSASKSEPLTEATTHSISDADLRTADPIDRISQSSAVMSQMNRNDRVILGLEEEEEES